MMMMMMIMMMMMMMMMMMTTMRTMMISINKLPGICCNIGGSKYEMDFAQRSQYKK